MVCYQPIMIELYKYYNLIKLFCQYNSVKYDTIYKKEVSYMAIYNRIKDLREDNDKTQAEIAEYLGTSAQHYGKYELGHAEIPFERAIMLAKYYNVSLDYIAGLTNDKNGTFSKPSDDAQMFLSFLRSLDDHDKQVFADAARYSSQI